MEVTKEDLNKQLNQALRNGYIMPYQGDAARKKFKKDGDVSILETIEVNKRAKELSSTKWHDLSDADALRTLVRQNNNSRPAVYKRMGYFSRYCDALRSSRFAYYGSASIINAPQIGRAHV